MLGRLRQISGHKPKPQPYTTVEAVIIGFNRWAVMITAVTAIMHIVLSVGLRSQPAAIDFLVRAAPAPYLLAVCCCYGLMLVGGFAAIYGLALTLGRVEPPIERGKLFLSWLRSIGHAVFGLALSLGVALIYVGILMPTNLPEIIGSGYQMAVIGAGLALLVAYGLPLLRLLGGLLFWLVDKLAERLEPKYRQLPERPTPDERPGWIERVA